MSIMFIFLLRDYEYVWHIILYTVCTYCKKLSINYHITTEIGTLLCIITTESYHLAISISTDIQYTRICRQFYTSKVTRENLVLCRLTLSLIIDWDLITKDFIEKLTMNEYSCNMSPPCPTSHSLLRHPLSWIVFSSYYTKKVKW